MAKDNIGGDGVHFTDIVKDLFNIEVNTILRDKITAQKMPSYRNALMDIGVEYFELLIEMETRRIENLKKNSQPHTELNVDKMRQSWKFYTEDEKKNQGVSDEVLIVEPLVCEQLGGFSAFAIAAKWAETFLRDPNCINYLNKQHVSVLPRIKENSDMLKGLFSQMCRRNDQLKKKGLKETLDKINAEGKLTAESVVQESRKIDKDLTLSLTNQYTRSDILSFDEIDPLSLETREAVLVRKVWEVGTEVIAMQTTIQIDGDVIERLNPNYLSDDVYPNLSEFHKSGVKMAMTYWGSLVTIARNLLGSLGGRITK
jgi:hypothetical protein